MLLGNVGPIRQRIRTECKRSPQRIGRIACQRWREDDDVSRSKCMLTFGLMNGHNFRKRGANKPYNDWHDLMDRIDRIATRFLREAWEAQVDSMTHHRSWKDKVIQRLIHRTRR